MPAAIVAIAFGLGPRRFDSLTRSEGFVARLAAIRTRLEAQAHSNLTQLFDEADRILDGILGTGLRSARGGTVDLDSKTKGGEEKFENAGGDNARAGIEAVARPAANCAVSKILPETPTPTRPRRRRPVRRCDGPDGPDAEVETIPEAVAAAKMVPAKGEIVPTRSSSADSRRETLDPSSQ